MKRISIAMATYNGERFLDEQLDSLAKQTLLPHELVICDDRSTDRTLAIAESFAQRAPFEVRIVRNERQLGYGDNFLKASRLCHGELIAFCDQDDVWLPEKLERCLQAFADLGVLLALHTGLVVDGQLQSQGILQPALEGNRTAPPGTANPWLIPPGFAMVLDAALIRDYPHDTRPRHPTSPEKAMPHDLWVYFLAGVLGHIAFITEPLTLYRQHDRNTCGAYRISAAEKLRLMLRRQWQSYAQTSGLADEYAAFLAGMAERASDPKRDLLVNGAAHYREISRRFACRQVLHQPETGRAQKLGSLIRLLRSGDYAKSRDHGGLGWLSVGKDSLMAILG
jgi:glycosyltransferase involved in cell wall biosynthesis